MRSRVISRVRDWQEQKKKTRDTLVCGSFHSSLFTSGRAARASLPQSRVQSCTEGAESSHRSSYECASTFYGPERRWNRGSGYSLHVISNLSHGTCDLLWDYLLSMLSASLSLPRPRQQTAPRACASAASGRCAWSRRGTAT